MKKILLAAICCMTIATSSVLAQDQPQRRGMRDGFRQQMFQLADTSITNQLNLTTAQQVEIAKLNENYLEQMKADGDNNLLAMTYVHELDSTSNILRRLLIAAR